MGKIWNKLTKKEPEKPATQDEIKQLKMDLERENLKLDIAKAKQAQPKKGLAKLFNSIRNETPEHRKSRVKYTKEGLGI